MKYLVFSQAASLDLARLAASAVRFFDSSLEVVHEGERGATVRLSGRYADSPVVFELSVRSATPDDRFAAREAEARGSAAGMGLLAERCRTIWELTADDRVPRPAVHAACAILASVALGPVLPPDGSTLFGVRGAIERAGAAPPPMRG